MKRRPPSESIAWLATAIRRLPSDDPVALGTPGYNRYVTQRDHWLGWLDPRSGTGTYPRADRPERDARDVYNRIVEPRMLLWLADAAGVPQTRLDAAKEAAREKTKLASQSAAIRSHIPWEIMAEQLSRLVVDEAR